VEPGGIVPASPLEASGPTPPVDATGMASGKKAGRMKYSVQIGAFLTRDYALQALDKMKKLGYGAYIYQQQDENGRNWYTVRIADSPDWETACLQAERFRKKEQASAAVVLYNALEAAKPPGADQDRSGRVPPAAPSRPYSLRVGAFVNRVNAEKAVGLYASRGWTACLSRVGAGGKNIWWAVYTGCFPSREAALKAKNSRSLGDALVMKTPYAILVASAESEAALKSRMELLRRNGQFPYLLQAADGTFRLYVGAYSTRRSAEGHLAEVNRIEGVTATIVQR